MENAEMCP